ncbi:hypothetical protein FRC03_003497 [Tulasnella sp. 419]|nr:hypothetical protein FRC03_003497 [Tulasnella sp. 419]
MQKNRQKSWGYTGSIGFENWERLSFYGRYVHTLVHSDLPGKTRVSSDAYHAIMQAAMGRPTILPNLRAIRWTLQDPSSTFGLSIFCSCNVMNLDLDISTGSSTTVLYVLQNLRGRTQNIRMLTLKLPEDMLVEATEDILTKLLAELSTLESLQLPQFFLSEKIMTTLGSHRGLKHLTQCTQNSNAPYDPYGCKLRLRPGSFPVLERLACNMDLIQATERFRANTAPRTLSHFYIGTGRTTTGTELKL